MRKFILIIILICMSVILYAEDDQGIASNQETVPNQKTTPEPITIEWIFSLTKAMNRSKETEMPIMIYMYEDWSKDHKNMEKKVFSNPKIIKKSKYFISLKLNVLSAVNAPYIMNRYDIKGVPYIIFIDKNTEVLNKFFGEDQASSPAKFLSSMNEALDMKNILPDIKTNEKPTIEALNYYINQYDADKSYEIFTKTLENNEIYSINDESIIYTLNEEDNAFYFYKIANIYLYQKKDLENARKVYIELISNCSTQKDYINQADMNIIRILNIQEDNGGIKNYINEILRRDTVSKKYMKFYINLLESIK